MENRGRSAAVILVVEDDEPIRSVVSLALADEGYTVISASNGAEAVRRLADRPQLILLDVRMPLMDGAQFLDAYRRMPPPHAPVVVVTAAPDPVALARQLGADAVLPKPFELRELLDRVQSLLDWGGSVAPSQ